MHVRLTTRLGSIVLFGVVLLALAGCGRLGPATAPQGDVLILATTTSTRDSGLLDVLVPRFEAQTGVQVKVIAVGTGAALRMGREGNADVLLVHAPAAEEEFMRQGYGLERRPVMYNDFVLVGPPDDPAAVRGEAVAEALRRIARAEALFLSRGDDSGTHKKERALWELAGISPGGAWYQESGQGMGATLKIASEKGAYTLSDRGTFLNLRDVVDLEVLVEGEEVLFNPYHVIVVNPERHPAVNAEAAKAFAEFLTSSAVQALIGEYGREQFGQPLFVPNAQSRGSAP